MGACFVTTQSLYFPSFARRCLPHLDHPPWFVTLALVFPRVAQDGKYALPALNPDRSTVREN